MGNFNRDRGGDRRGGGGFNRRDSGRGFDRGGSDRPTMHHAVCDACKKDCEVPFRPSGGKPIFCSDCFSKQGGGNDRPKFGGGDRDRKPRFDGGGGSSDNSKEILKGVKTLNYKLDELIKALSHSTPDKKTAAVDVDFSETKPSVPSKKKSTAKIGKRKDATPKKVVKAKTPKKKVVAKKPSKKK